METLAADYKTLKTLSLKNISDPEVATRLGDFAVRCSEWLADTTTSAELTSRVEHKAYFAFEKSGKITSI